MTLPVYNDDQIAYQLTDGYWQYVGWARHSFAVSVGGTLNVDISALTTAGQQLAHWALDAWTLVSGINFSYVTSGIAAITFDDSSAGAYTSVTASGSTTTTAAVNISTDWLAEYGTSNNGYSFQTYIHEIGHALGLGHAGNYNGDATYGVDNQYLNDSWQASVMSYFDQIDNTYVDASKAYDTTPMAADIIAIQALYGTASSHTGNDTYTFTDVVGSPTAMTIYDTGGIDTLNFSGVSKNQVINLTPETFSNVGGLVGNLGIARGTIIENVIGGTGNDTISGNDVANDLKGGAGNDHISGGGSGDNLFGGAGADALDGGDGFDFARYDDATGGVIANLGNSAGNTGDAFGDTYVSIEGVVGSAYGDLLLGDGGSNTLYGMGGGDNLVGGAGNDRLYGQDGDDNLYGGVGADALDGGSGTDFARYDDAATGVIANLGNASGNAGDAAGDTYVSVEGIVGSSIGDLLSGDNAGNIIYGQGGGDNLLGGGGDDSLYGGDGNDNIYGGTGADYIAGDSGFDAARYDTASAGVTAVLINSSLNAGDAAGDRYYSIEALVGSSFNDNLIGDNGNNLISGGDGNDAITGYAGNDTLYGGAGGDVFFFRDNSGYDVIADFTAASMSAVHDTLFLASNLNGSGITDFSSAIAHAAQNGGNVLIDLSAGNAITLQSVQLGQLTASDFAFG